jgi:hypothetical protein
MRARLTRLAPLTGVAYVGCVVAATVMPSSPDVNASSAKVITYYTAHHTAMQAQTYLLAYAAVFVVFFAGVVAGYLRGRGATNLAPAIVGGAVLMAVGLATGAAINSVLTDHTSGLTASSAQTLNRLSNDLPFIALFAGLCTLMLATGIAMLTTKSFPAWVGWVTIVIGIAAATGIGSWPALLASGLWTLGISSVLVRRAGKPADITMPDVAAARTESTRATAQPIA